MRVDRLDTMYRYALTRELCKNKGNFAELIGVTNSTLSKAFSGEEKYLSDAFLIRVNNALNNVFSLDWVLYGTGEMLKESAGADIVIDNSHSHHNNSNAGSGTQIIGGNDDAWKKVVADKDEQIAYLKQQIEELKADKEKLYQILFKRMDEA